MDLEFKEGDTIELLEKVDVDWFKGKIGQNHMQCIVLDCLL